MSTLFRSFRNKHLSIAIYFLCALVAMLFLSITASAGDDENSTGKSAESRDSPLSLSQAPVDQSQGAGCCDTQDALSRVDLRDGLPQPTSSS